MKSKIIGVAALLAMTVAAQAAALDVSGTIKTIDSKSHMVTLQDGKAYALASSVDLKGFRSGEKVKINYEVRNGKNMASSITAAK